MPRGVYDRKVKDAKAPPKPAKPAKPTKEKKTKVTKVTKSEPAVIPPEVPVVTKPRAPKKAGRIAYKPASMADVKIVEQNIVGYKSPMIKDRFQIFQSSTSKKKFNIYDHFAIARDGLPGNHVRDKQGDIVLFDSVEEANLFLKNA